MLFVILAAVVLGPLLCQHLTLVLLARGLLEPKVLELTVKKTSVPEHSGPELVAPVKKTLVPKVLELNSFWKETVLEMKSFCLEMARKNFYSNQRRTTFPHLRHHLLRKGQRKEPQKQGQMPQLQQEGFCFSLPCSYHTATKTSVVETNTAASKTPMPIFLSFITSSRIRAEGTISQSATK